MLLYMLFNPIDLHMFQFVLCIYIYIELITVMIYCNMYQLYPITSNSG